MSTARSLAAWCRLEAQAALSFRVQLMTQVFGWVVPLAFMALWGFATNATGIMTQGQTTAYYLVQLVMTTLTFTYEVVFGLGMSLYSGELSMLVLMPFPPILSVMAKPVIRAVIGSVPLIIIVPLLSWTLRADYAVEPATVVAAIMLGMVGWLSTLAFCCVCGLSAFWMGKWDAVLSLVLGVQWVLGGLIAPSVFTPPWLAWTMRLSPLWLGSGGVAELLSGAVPLAWWMPVVGAGWAVGLIVAFRVAWPHAMRRYEGVGI